jgi:O-antigen/teichoic acid export membrane protein
MTQVIPTTIKAKDRFWAAIGGPVGLWSALSKGSSDLSWVLAGKFALMGANAVLMLFLANRLELKTYGLLVVTISGQLLISRFLMLGVDAGMVRLSAIPELRPRAQEVVTAGLVIMACTSGVLLVLMLLGLPLRSWFAMPGWVLLCIAAGAIGTALVDYGYSFRLASHEYPLAGLAQGGTAILRLGLTMLVAFKLPAYPAAVFVAYHGASLFSGLVQTLFIGKDGARPARALTGRLLRYSFWLGQANVMVIFSLYQGTFLLTILDQPAETGLFGLALTLSLGFFAINTAYTEYLSVRVRSVSHVIDLPQFIRRSDAVALLLMLACVPIAIAVAILISRLLGPEWHEIVPVFLYLSGAMVLMILQAPLVAACHFLLKPQLITFQWAAQSIFILIVGLVLAPRLGATGAAIAQLLGSAAAWVVLSYLVAAASRSATTVER